MKKAAVIILNIIVIGGILGCALCWHWHELRPWFELNRRHIESLTLPDQPTLSGCPKLVAAIKSYSLDHTSHGQPLPASLTLQDLVNGGYIDTNDSIGLDGANTRFYPIAKERDPKAILVQMRMSDGRQIVLLADGSIQQLK